MEAVVSHKYRYVMYYSPKVGCSSLRNLFLALHKDELDETQSSRLNGFHNLSEIFPYEAGRDYSDYFKFNIKERRKNGCSINRLHPRNFPFIAFLDHKSSFFHSGIIYGFSKEDPSGLS